MNIYDNPEKFGLELVGMVDTGGNDFCMFVVWKQGRRLGYITDSGCSCPSPFEDKGLDDLTLAPKADVIKALKDWSKNPDRSERPQDDIDASVAELCLKIRAA